MDTGRVDLDGEIGRVVGTAGRCTDVWSERERERDTLYMYNHDIYIYTRADLNFRFGEDLGPGTRHIFIVKATATF